MGIIEKTTNAKKKKREFANHKTVFLHSLKVKKLIEKGDKHTPQLNLK